MSEILKVRWTLCVLIVCLFFAVSAHSKRVKIAGLFNTRDEENAFKSAVRRVNQQRKDFPSRPELVPLTDTVVPYDSFHASKKLCGWLKEGIAGMFGPQSGSTASLMQSIAERLGIPYIQTRWNFNLHPSPMSVNLYPHPQTLSEAYVDIVKRWEYDVKGGFVIIYEDNEGLMRLQELLKQDFPLTLRRLHKPYDFHSQEGEDKAFINYQILFKKLKNSGIGNIILDSHTDRLLSLQKAADSMSMMTVYHQYLITSLDVHSLPKWETSANVTTLRLVNTEKASMVYAADTILHPGSALSRQEEGLRLKTEAALMYDAVYLFSQALYNYWNTKWNVSTVSIYCEYPQRWEYGRGLLDYMKMMQLDDLTGNLQLNQTGYRMNYSFNIEEVWRKGNPPNMVGTWNDTDGLHLKVNFSARMEETKSELSSTDRIVATKLNDPYLMLKKNHEDFTGNDKYVGFVKDLLDDIAKNLNFTYTIKLITGSYGSKSKADGKWEEGSAIRMLQEQTADLAIGDMTITSEREEVVDFTTPFMALGITIIYKKPDPASPNLFSFLSPLSVDVWMYLATAYLGVSVFLFLLARFTPYEWNNPHPCNPEPEELENQFSLCNSAWFTTGSLLQQGCDFLPKAASTRLVAGIWWFFTLIMISSYTANLAAFLTASRMTTPINSADDLAKQTKIKYGCPEKGTTRNMFEESTSPTFQRMATFMKNAQPSVYMSNNDEGIRRVLQGGYAFILESTAAEYWRKQNCSLIQIGGLLDSKGYGIAFPLGSKFRTLVSQEILKLQESGAILKYKDKWWRKLDGPECDSEDDKGSGATAALGMANVGGVFVVLFGGLGLACVIGIVEFIWVTHRTVQEEGGIFKEELVKELKFAVDVKLTRKPIEKESNGSGNDNGNGNGATGNGMKKQLLDTNKILPS